MALLSLRNGVCPLVSSARSCDCQAGHSLIKGIVVLNYSRRGFHENSLSLEPLSMSNLRDADRQRIITLCGVEEGHGRGAFCRLCGLPSVEDWELCERYQAP